MKKRIWIPILVILLLLAAFELTMEQRYSIETIVPADVSDEEILSEMPEISITEEDRALEAYVLALPQVQEMLVRADGDSTKREAMGQAEIQPILADWTQPGWSASELLVWNGVVYVAFQEDNGETMYIYTFYPNSEMPMAKTIGLYQADGDQRDCKVLYSNHDGQLTKEVSKHQWFAWIGHLTGQDE